MNQVLLFAVATGLLLIAASGVLYPVISRRAPAVEVPPDPLEERRLSLLHSIKDLEAARGAGDLEDDEYQRLRLETESRLVRVLNVIEQRSSGVPGKPAKVGGAERPGRIPRWIAGTSVSLVVLGITAAGIKGSLAPRPEGATFTGTVPGTDPNENLAFFESRVKSNPRDVAARLDLGHRYLEAARTGDAVQQYLRAVDVDPNNAEANAHMGLLLFMGGSSDNALKAVDRALSVDSGYAEALFFKGVILLKGLNQPAPAKEAFQAYLKEGSAGSEQERARQFLAEAEAALAQSAG